MSDPEKKICRYFNTLGGCWYGDSCKFLHIPDKKPPCKFYGSSSGCRYGESCHFSHDRTPFKSVENYNNPPVELVKEVFKENVDPSELSGTNNNNMTQSTIAHATTEQLDSGLAPNINVTNTAYAASSRIPADAVDPDCGYDGQGKKAFMHQSFHAAQDPISISQGNGAEASEVFQLTSAATSRSLTSIKDTITSNTNNNLASPTEPAMRIANSECTDTGTRISQELVPQEAANLVYFTREEDGQNCALSTVSGRPNGVTNEIEIYCGSCKRILERRSNESYCTLLKDHYLECFLDKEGDHVKYVKTKAALEPGQMYWCKSCILIFEKPWSLFQHMADKAKGSKVQRWEKKIHLDWMDSVAGLMAGYDLGLFSPAKLRVDLRNLLADQHTMEEEMEAAAVTAAAMMQWLAPLSSPWRLQQREMMRKIEQLNRQMLRKANLGLANGSSGTGGYPTRGALTAPGAAAMSHSLAYTVPTRANNGVSSNTPGTQRVVEVVNSELKTDLSSRKSPTRIMECEETTDPVSLCPAVESETRDLVESQQVASNAVGPLGDGDSQNTVPKEESQTASENADNPCASGDALLAHSDPNKPKPSCDTGEAVEQHAFEIGAVDSNNTNSIPTKSSSSSAKGDDGNRRVEFKRAYNSAPAYAYPFSKGIGPTGMTFNGRGNSESLRYPMNSRLARTPGYGHNTNGFNTSGHRFGPHRPNRFNTASSAPPTRAATGFNPPSFHASMDFNCGFTDDEVEELLSQGIRPWDSEAAAALAVLRGELDHLLD